MSTEWAVLDRCAPSWAAPLPSPPGISEWLVAPPLPSGMPIAAHILKIAQLNGFLSVSERRLGDRLPAACPELHINTDGSFCLERRVFRAGDGAQVLAFWQSLGEFLINQHYAERRGFWPAGRWLSHGPLAADMQVTAEVAAAAMGITDEYAAWLESGEGWLAGSLPALNPATLKLRLAGVNCPRGCRDAAGLARPLRHCMHRAAMVRLIEAEQVRRLAQDRFFAGMRARGMQCCGRLANCPLYMAEVA